MLTWFDSLAYIKKTGKRVIMSQMNKKFKHDQQNYFRTGVVIQPSWHSAGNDC